MGKQSSDRRVNRTRALIADAFLKVLQEKPYPEVTIMDIAEQATINRSTFYAHYIDKEDLLQSLLEEKLGELSELIIGCQDAASAYSPSFDTPDFLYSAIFEHLDRHDTFYRIMLNRIDSAKLQTRMQEMIREGFYLRVSKLELNQKLQVPLDILLDFIACSVQGMIMKWFADQRIYSSHYMALQLTRLSQLGIYEAMGMSSDMG